MDSIVPDAELVKRIIAATQEGLPVCDRPYRRVAEQVGLSEEQLLVAMQQMLDDGVIRRIGLVPNHYALGYRYNLMTVWDVDDADINHLGEQVGKLDGVSHCYQRPRRLPDWRYNFFAMVHGRTEAEVAEQAAQIEGLLGPACRAKTQLNSLKILKKTGLRIR